MHLHERRVCYSRKYAIVFVTYLLLKGYYTQANYCILCPSFTFRMYSLLHSNTPAALPIAHYCGWQPVICKLKSLCPCHAHSGIVILGANNYQSTCKFRIQTVEKAKSPKVLFTSHSGHIDAEFMCQTCSVIV